MRYRPRYIVPLLVEQPTWGGQYIASFKNIADPAVRDKPIGQAFELYGESQVVAKLGDNPTFGFASATQLSTPRYFGFEQPLERLQNLIESDPNGYLGRAVVEQHGLKLQTLIKFTQAQNNSYQVHVRPNHTLGHWQPKPESWYYFESGLVTLGLAPDCDLDAYRQRCHAINQHAIDLSSSVKDGNLTVKQARQQLAAFIQIDHPRRFVNTVRIERDQVVDLSAGGTHHSWEVDPQQPLGNIVYEVQLDVLDENCTLRSFDQGSIKDDGSVRPLTIDHYFQALNTHSGENQPSKLIRNHTAQNQQELCPLFTNHFYRSSLLTFTDHYQGSATQLNDRFHHLFAKTGAITISTGGPDYPLPQGWSIFIPAGVGEYQLTTQDTDDHQKNEVIITSA